MVVMILTVRVRRTNGQTRPVVVLAVGLHLPTIHSWPVARGGKVLCSDLALGEPIHEPR